MTSKQNAYDHQSESGCLNSGCENVGASRRGESKSAGAKWSQCSDIQNNILIPIVRSRMNRNKYGQHNDAATTHHQTLKQEESVQVGRIIALDRPESNVMNIKQGYCL
jgi:hypothetical protein